MTATWASVPVTSPTKTRVVGEGVGVVALDDEPQPAAARSTHARAARLARGAAFGREIIAITSIAWTVAKPVPLAYAQTACDKVISSPGAIGSSATSARGGWAPSTRRGTPWGRSP